MFKTLFGSKKLDIIYFIMVVFVPVFFVFRLLFFGQMLTGDDPSTHAMNAMYYVFPIPYSPFYLTIDYYPSLLQNIWSLICFVTRFNIVDIMRYFMFVTFIFGFVIYALICVKISGGDKLKGYFLILVLAFSVSPIIKTLRDGSYIHVFAAWFLLPLFIYFFINRKLLFSSVMGSLIFYTHNLSTFLLLAFIGAYTLSDLITNKFNLRYYWDDKFIIKTVALMITFSIPAFLIAYLPKISSLFQSGQTGFETSALSVLDYPLLFTNLSIYLGLISSLIILFFYRRKFIPLWGLFYFLLAQYPPFSERIVREMCVPFALSMGVVFFDFLSYVVDRGVGRGVFKQFMDSSRVKILGLFVISLAIISNGLPMIMFESNPVTMYYYSEMKGGAYAFLGENINGVDKVVVLRGMDIWAKIVLPYGSVYEVIAPSLGSSISIADSKINGELTYALSNPFTDDSLEILARYKVRYFVVSSPLRNRWYVGEDYAFNHEMLKTKYESFFVYQLVYFRESGDEMIKVYQVIYH